MTKLHTFPDAHYTLGHYLRGAGSSHKQAFCFISVRMLASSSTARGGAVAQGYLVVLLLPSCLWKEVNRAHGTDGLPLREREFPTRCSAINLIRGDTPPPTVAITSPKKHNVSDLLLFCPVFSQPSIVTEL